MVFDYLQIIFWSITYLLIIIYGIKFKKLMMPILALILNFSWEIVAFINDIVRFELISFAFIGHLIWLSLDLIMFIIYINIYIKNKKRGFIPIIITLAILTNVFVLLYAFSLNDGMLLSVFIIDLIMAALYVLFFIFNTYKSSLLLDAIIFSKLLGDLFARVEYKDDHIAVLIIGIVILILNIACYVVYFLKFKGIIKKSFE